MKDVYIDSITKDSELEEAMFLEILEVPDLIDRQAYIEEVRKKCRSLGRAQEFNNMLKAYMMQNAMILKQQDSKDTQFTDQPIKLKCGRYAADDTGVFLSEITKQGGVVTHMACPHPILPVERMINIDTDMEKVKVAFFKDARWRNVTIDCGMAFNRTQISQLADRGVIVTSESAKDLVKYLSEVVSLNMDTLPLYNSVSRFGWIGNDFAPYVDSVKYDGDMDFQVLYGQIKEEGDYAVWLEHIRELREDINIRLALDASLASVLIEKVGGLPFVLHFWGNTSFGKTVTLMVAASVWGDPKIGALTRSLNMTANAMARTAAFLYNIPFCADELQQIKDRWGGNYDTIIMYLCEGIDRGRAKSRGGIEEVRTWKNSFILTGEEPVTKNSSGGGAKNRCLEIEVRERIIKDGNKTANLVRENYGFAGKRFVEYVQGKKAADMQADYKEIFKEILESSNTTDKQAMSMALILLADRYASECIFEDEPIGCADVRQFLRSAETVDVSERAYNWVVDWISENRIRFNEDQDENRGALWGKIDEGVATVNKSVIVAAMSKAGFEFSACSRKWGEVGRLIKNSQGKYTQTTSVAGIRANYVKIALPEPDFEDFDGDLPFNEKPT